MYKHVSTRIPRAEGFYRQEVSGPRGERVNFFKRDCNGWCTTKGDPDKELVVWTPCNELMPGPTTRFVWYERSPQRSPAAKTKEARER